MPYSCPDCGADCAWEIVVRAHPPVKPHPTYERTECACEAAEREKRERRGEEEKRAAEETARAVRVAAAWKRAGIAGRMLRQTFEAWEPGASKRNDRVKEKLENWAHTFEPGQTERGYLLYSKGYGNGKTHLAIASAHVLLNRGVAAHFTTMLELLAAIRAEFSGPANEKGRVLEYAATVPLLVIDDFGTERVANGGDENSWALEQISDVFNKRSRHGLPLLVTTNLLPPQIEAHLGGGVGAGRIVSRLAGLADTLEMDGQDWRAK